MKSHITDIYHDALRANGLEKYEECRRFYGDILGLTFVREWNDTNGPAMMFTTGKGIVEIFSDAEGPRALGPTDHVAFATEDPDACIEAVRAAGYEVTMEPKDINVETKTTPLVARIAFCLGPIGESIEFFYEK